MTLTLKKPVPAGTNTSNGGWTDSEIWCVPVVSGLGYNSDFVAYSGDTAFTGIGSAMVAGKLYMYQATTDTWICQSNAGTAAAKAVGSMFVQKGIQILIDGSQGSKLHVLQDVTTGNASLVEVTA
jgi:hypothetical protein